MSRLACFTPYGVVQILGIHCTFVSPRGSRHEFRGARMRFHMKNVEPCRGARCSVACERWTYWVEPANQIG